ncbi:hypothetical protein [Aurantimonas sp. VKM B-3413]|uniref:hypothetical protein n=1 Tax=Aurantimonas sp. VKM B-3413 TaxID=2779401 RepID=UPI001E55289C|nr:hypothetical protein [Aurantimonas sp. VKM B-3413]MCB8836874.1 hypothetical protein [Aurantimonas sp. VKM B-3413]
MAELTNEQAYRAMFEFLKRHWERTGSDDVGALLSDLQLFDDGIPGDPAALDDWRDCVASVLKTEGREAAE